MNLQQIEELLTKVLEEKTFSNFYNSVRNILENKAQATINYFVQEEISPSNIAKYIDHTILKPEATSDDIKKICEEAVEHSFASVCVNPSFVFLSSELLSYSAVKVCTVIGFPLGAASSEVKRYETEQAIMSGAQEVDMVINIGRLKQGDYEFVYDDIFQVVNTALFSKVTSKVIIETALLTNEEKIKACLLSKCAGADFVKTSTGFSKGGATVEDVFLMRQVVGKTMGVKASGGIRDFETAAAMIKAGANRIGASASVGIVSQS